MKFQIGVSLDVLHETIRSHLEDYGTANAGYFRSSWSEPGSTIRLLDLVFSRNRSFSNLSLDLGVVRLRWLGAHITEMRFEDSDLLRCSTEDSMKKWGWELQDLPPDRQKCVAVAALRRLNRMHSEVRQFLLERLKEDRFLGSGSAMPGQSKNFVDPSRLERLRLVKSTKFDLTKIIRLCEELNICFDQQCFLATGSLLRALIDHVPPIFGASSFREVANNFGSKSVKASLKHLDISSRNIADHILHQQIRGKEVLPSATQVDFSRDLDVLLAELLRRLS